MIKFRILLCLMLLGFSDSCERFWAEEELRIEEGKRYLEDYYQLIHADSIRTYAYEGRVDLEKQGLGQNTLTLHYRMYEEDRKGIQSAKDIYIDDDLSDTYFYTVTEEDGWEKCLTCTWTGENGETWSYAFSLPFFLDGEGIDVKGDINMTVFRNGELHETEEFPGGWDWISAEAEMYVKDFNFDGYPDVGIPIGPSSNWGGITTCIYIREEKNGEASYRYSDSFVACPRPDKERKLLYGYNRGGANQDSYFAYEYRDGTFAEIAFMDVEWQVDKETEEEFMQYTIGEENGNLERYSDELPEKWEEFWEPIF